MEYKDDNELILMIRESNDNFPFLYDKYKKIIRGVYYKWRSVISNLGIDYEDFLQECLLIFFQSIIKYNFESNATFFTLFYGCINKKIYDYLRIYYKRKDILVFSYDTNFNEEDDYLSLIRDDYDIECDYTFRKFWKNIREFIIDLSFEKACVFELYLSGYSILDISVLLDLNQKYISNVIFREKSKFRKKYLEL